MVKTIHRRKIKAISKIRNKVTSCLKGASQAYGIQIQNEVLKLAVANFLFLCLLAIFPFGQIFRFGDVLFLDIVVGFIAIFTLFTVKKYPKWYKYFTYFLVFALFSWIVNLFLIKNLLLLKSFLYLVRLFTYSLFPIFVFNNFKKDKSLVINSALFVVFVVAIFGWLQYLLAPDLRLLKILNWDDHYYRLVGTFLDPGFTAIILVLGSILALYKKKYLAFTFLSFTVLYTYSRAGYLALFVSLFYYFLKTKKLKHFLFLFVWMLVIGYWLLPGRAGGEGVKLTRTSTISARLLNYQQSIEIFKNSPVIGVGYNNICAAKMDDINSHSCFGLDNSILYLLATTGIVGLILFASWVLRVGGSFHTSYILLHTSVLAVVISSFFANTLFYSHIMAWIGILVGLQKKS